MKLAFAALALATLISAPASAAPFTWEFTGTITSTNVSPFSFNPPGGNPFTVGDAFKFVLTMESTTPDTGSSPTCGNYIPFKGATLSDGSFSATGGTVGVLSVHSSAWTSANNGVDCTNIPPSANSGIAQVQGLFANGITQPFAVVFEHGGNYLTDALPTSLANFGIGTFEIDYSFGFNTRNTIASARITGERDITAPVPEPASALLLGGGMLAGIWKRRRRSVVG